MDMRHARQLIFFLRNMDCMKIPWLILVHILFLLGKISLDIFVCRFSGVHLHSSFCAISFVWDFWMEKKVSYGISYKDGGIEHWQMQKSLR